MITVFRVSQLFSSSQFCFVCLSVCTQYVRLSVAFYKLAGVLLHITLVVLNLKFSFSGMQFSTNDNDNDEKDYSCAQKFKGAWWYKHCHESNLNGLYLNGSHSSEADGVNWRCF